MRKGFRVDLLSVKSAPNIITVARLVAVPVIVWLIVSERMTAAFWLFIVAGVSDAVDGYLAKKLNAESVLGSYLDPLADKILLVAVYLLLGHAGFLPVWLVVLVILRDSALLGGSILMFVSDRRVAIRPLIISKINTGLQIVLAGFVLAHRGFDFPDFGVTMALVYAVGLTTVLSASAYLWRFHREGAEGAQRRQRGGRSPGGQREGEG